MMKYLPEYLKSVLHLFYPPLTHIFNKTLRTGIFPERMKYSVVKPIFKKRVCY
jgi:hypothetical protein